MPSGCARIPTSSISITTFSRAGLAAGHERRSVQDNHDLWNLEFVVRDPPATTFAASSHGRMAEAFVAQNS